MSNHIDTYYSLGSPWTHLGWDRLHAIATRHGASIAYFPVDFGVVFPATGGFPLPKRSPERRAYRMMELKRWKAFLGAGDFNIEPEHFPVDANPATRMAIAAREQGGDVAGLSRAVLRAQWCEERDISDSATLTAIAEACGFDGAALLAAAEKPEMAERLARDTEAAIDRGVFGAPSYVLGDEIFWGQDRLDFLDRALAAP